MFKDLIFCNNGYLSLIDLTTMGDSSKRDCSDKIGKFDSGLKYALVILLRNGIKAEIISNNVTYTFDTTIQRDDNTSKTKEVLEIVQSQNDNEIRIPTAFAINMGHEWELWMAIREIYSNCIDENGSVYNEIQPNSKYDTIIKLSGNEMLQSIIDSWDDYFITNKIPLAKTYSVSIYKNNSSFLKIYKSGILIYKNENIESQYIYDVPSASIDEMRILNDLYNVKNEISYAITAVTNKSFIKDFLSEEKQYKFENSLTFPNPLSEEWIQVVNEVFKDAGEIKTYDSLIESFMDNSKIDIGVRRVSKKELNWSEQKVVVKTPEKQEKVILSFEERIKLICKKEGFNVILPIILSEISGLTCIADVNRKVIYVTKEFSSENVWELIKAHYRIEHKNDSDAIFKDYQNLLKKSK